MPVPVPADVIFSYNGYNFSPYIYTRLVEKPITSGDNRQVKFSELTISVTGWITQLDADGLVGAVAGEPLDAFMLRLRRQLQVHGKTLKYVNKGYGGADLNINDFTGA